MSIQLMSSPNGVAATCQMDADIIMPYSKITIPKMDVDPEVNRQCFPLAMDLFSRLRWASRMSLTNIDGKTAISINIVGAFNKQLEDEPWKARVSEDLTRDITQFFAKRQPAIIPENFSRFELEILEKIETFDELTGEEKALIQAIHDSVNADKLSKDAGGYDIVDLEGDARWLRAKEHNRVGVIATFGNCVGCGSFDQTFGDVPGKVNKAMEDAGNSLRLLPLKQHTQRGPLIIR